MNELNDTIQDLPLAGLIPVLLLIVAGLLLWAAGRRVLRVVFATAGLILGFGLGWMFAQSWDIGLEPWIPAAILGLALGCTGALVYRVALAGALAVVCAIAGPAAVVAAGEMQGVGPETPTSEVGEPGFEMMQDPDPADLPLPFGTTEIHDAANDWLDPPPEAPPDAPPDAFPDAFPDALPDASPDALPDTSPSAPPDAHADEAPDADAQDTRSEALDHLTQAGLEELGLGEGAASKVSEARGYAERLIAGMREWWARTPRQLRPAMIGAAITGGLVGLLFGTLAPSLTAVVVSAFGGSMLWLSAGRVLLARLGESPETILAPSVTGTVVLWLITSLVGVAIQWTFRPKPTDKAG